MVDELKKTIKSLLDKNTRFDGRGLHEYREVSIKTDVSNNAEGSAVVKIGETEVMAGIKMELSTPYPDTPNQGGLMINVELLPLSNPKFEFGPPGAYAIELARVTDRVIRESKLLDVKDLCLVPGKSAWTIIVDIVSINDAGNLFDAISLAAAAALKNARFPEIKDDAVNYKVKTDTPLPIKQDLPINVTLLKYGKHIIVDPDYEENDSFDARLSVGVMADGNFCSLQKGGEEPISTEELSLMLDLASKVATDLRKNF